VERSRIATILAGRVEKDDKVYPHLYVKLDKASFDALNYICENKLKVNKDGQLELPKGQQTQLIRALILDFAEVVKKQRQAETKSAKQGQSKD